MLDRLRTSVETRGNAYFGRFDLNKVVLVGHSRGGDAVVQVARLNAKRITKYGVVGVCSLAPTDFSGIAVAGDGPFVLTANETPFFLAIQAALDGDVSGVGGANAGTGTAFRHYARAQCQKALVQLTECCHNRFNTTWSKEPVNRANDDSDLVDTEFNVLHTHATHRQLFTEYLTVMLDKQVRNNPKDIRLFTGERANSAGVAAAHSVGVRAHGDGDGQLRDGRQRPRRGTDDDGRRRRAVPRCAGAREHAEGRWEPTTLVAITEHATHVTKLADLDTAVAACRPPRSRSTCRPPSAKLEHLRGRQLRRGRHVRPHRRHQPAGAGLDRHTHRRVRDHRAAHGAQRARTTEQPRHQP